MKAEEGKMLTVIDETTEECTTEQEYGSKRSANRNGGGVRDTSASVTP